MQTPVIKFEKGDYSTGAFQEFIVDNTPENWNLILSDRFSRNIRAEHMFDFQYEKEMSIPVEYIDMRIWATLTTLLFDSNQQAAIVDGLLEIEN